MRGRSRRNREAFTLLEVVIASGILAIVLASAMTGILFVSRMSQAAQQDLMAMEVLERETELIRAAPNYAALGDPAFSGPHPTNPAYDEQSFTEQRIRAYDPNFENGGPTFRIDYTWYGFGEASGGAANRLEFDQTGWPEGVDFEGNILILREGPGAGQMARIDDHLEGQFVLNTAFNGYTRAELVVPPASGTRFEVDGGKWVRVTARWTPPGGGVERVVERMLFVGNRPN
jgi:prepilin-type N-terminal cleavage/methylation domain-containing protein